MDTAAGLWRRFWRRSWWIKAPTLAVVFFILLGAIGAAMGGGEEESEEATPRPSQTSTAMATPSLEASPTSTPTETPRPTATNTPKPTATNIPAPTNTPKPTSTLACGAPKNPWGHDFCPGGALIYSPPSDFCSYFACIGNFWNGRGHVIQCRDEMYSKSGGIQGSCSYHGGNRRPLYAFDAPQLQPPPQQPPAQPSNCDPSYLDVCIPSGSADYDCAGGSGNGPNYISGPIRVLPPDPHGLDSDGDGWGCE